MTKVYLVTYGDYSDYGIHGAFSTKELAEAAIVSAGYGDVEEWTLDRGLELIKSGESLWLVQMDREGASYAYKQFPGDIREDKVYASGSHRYHFNVVAKDEATAVKIANERRRQLIAENKI